MRDALRSLRKGFHVLRFGQLDALGAGNARLTSYFPGPSSSISPAFTPPGHPRQPALRDNTAAGMQQTASPACPPPADAVHLRISATEF